MPALPKSDRKRFRDQTCLFAFMKSERTDRGAGTGVAASVTNFAAKHGTQTRFDKTPRPHVLRLFLAPDQPRFFRKGFDSRAQLFFIQRIELLDADDRTVGDFFFGAGLKKTFEPGAGMFRSLPFVAVRQK